MTDIYDFAKGESIVGRLRDLKALTHRKDPPRLLKMRPSWQVLENRRKVGSPTAACHTRKTVTDIAS